MKKLLVTLCALLALTVTAFGLASCTGKTPKESGTDNTSIQTSDSGSGNTSESDSESTSESESDSTPATYVITWMNGEELLKLDSVTEGETPEYTDDEPTKDADEQYTYEFAGWDPEVVPATANATYTAVFTPVLNKYTVTFVDLDGTELQSGLVEYGATPEYAGEEPSKDSDAEFNYAFAGWTPALAPVSGDVTYTVAYSMTSGDGYIISSYTYDSNADISYRGENATGATEHLDSFDGETGVEALNITWNSGYQEFIQYRVWNGSKTIKNDQDVIRVHLRSMAQSANPIWGLFTAVNAEGTIGDSDLYSLGRYAGPNWTWSRIGFEEWKWIEIPVSTYGLKAGDALTNFYIVIEVAGNEAAAYDTPGAGSYTGTLIWVDAVEFKTGALGITAEFDAAAAADAITADSALDELKSYLTVNAVSYENGATAVAAEDYTLTGTLVKGEEVTITVTYNEMTATFKVTAGSSNAISTFSADPNATATGTWGNATPSLTWQETAHGESGVMALGISSNNGAQERLTYTLWTGSKEVASDDAVIRIHLRGMSLVGNPINDDCAVVINGTNHTIANYAGTGWNTYWADRVGAEEWKWLELNVSEFGLEAGDTITSFGFFFDIAGSAAQSYGVSGAATYTGTIIWVDAVEFKEIEVAAEPENVISSFSSNPNATATSANSNATPTVTWQASAYDENGVMALGLDSYNGSQDVLTYTLWTGSKTVSSDDDVIRIHLRSMAAIPNPIWDGLWVSANGGEKKMLDRYAREPDWSSWDSKIGYETWKWIEVSVSDLGLHAGDTITSFEVVIGVHNNEANDYSYYGAGTCITSGDMLWVDAVEFKVAE